MKPDFQNEAENFAEMNYGGTQMSTYIKTVATNSYKAGYHSRDKEIEELKAEIERLKATS